jgi:hypothetical protein
MPKSDYTACVQQSSRITKKKEGRITSRYFNGRGKSECTKEEERENKRELAKAAISSSSLQKNHLNDTRGTVHRTHIHKWRFS